MILILNNDGYGTMRKILDGDYNVITRWNYGKIVELIGAGSASIAATKGDLDAQLGEALRTQSLRVIDVRLPRNDVSPQLAEMGVEMARLRGEEITGL